MHIGTAVVLAAGKGTRLRPLTQYRPKPMLPAGNRPILAHVFDALVAAGVDRLVTVVGYKRDRVQSHFGATYRGVPITYVTQHKQLGSGHALLQAQSVVDGPTLVVNGDQVIAAETVEAVADTFSETGDPTLAVVEQQDAQHYGAVEVRNGGISALVETPQDGASRLINGGVYAVPADIFTAIDATPRQAGELALTDTVTRLLDRGQVRSVDGAGLWVDATYPWDLLAVARAVLARGRINEPPRRDQVWIADSAQVHTEAVLQRPVVIGPDCAVGPEAVVGPHVALGANVTVGANTVVQASVLDADTRVDPGSTLLETVTGQDVHLGAGTVVTGGPGDIRSGPDLVAAQRLGAVIADRVRAQGDVRFEPGSVVGPNATLSAGVTVAEPVAEGATVTR